MLCNQILVLFKLKIIKTELRNKWGASEGEEDVKEGKRRINFDLEVLKNTKIGRGRRYQSILFQFEVC